MTELSCSGSGFGAPPEEARYDGDGDQPALLEDQPLSLVIHSDARRSGRVVAYGVPRALAGVPLELSVYDVAGRRMQTLVRGPSIPGRYAVPLGYGPGDTPVCGVYFVRLRVGGETLRRRVVVW